MPPREDRDHAGVGTWKTDWPDAGTCRPKPGARLAPASSDHHLGSRRARPTSTYGLTRWIGERGELGLGADEGRHAGAAEGDGGGRASRAMTPIHGDVTLAARVGDLLGPRHRVVGAATVTSSGTTLASLGAGSEADFEIGSISKGVTGMLYVEALARGETKGSTTLGELLPLGDVPAAAVTLASLTVHRSGLPRLAPGAQPLRRTLALWRHGTNPYGESLEELLSQARTVRLARPKPRYSNLGFELLGHALAAAAGATYPSLVSERIALPLGLSTLYAPVTPAELRPTALVGRSRNGRPRQPWTGEGITPAGGLRATVADMAALVSALLEGSAPGVAALDPVATLSGSKVRIGAAWITLEHGGRQVTWHNGGTGGFRSWIGLDRKAGTGVALLTATAASVDQHGFTLLAELTPHPTP